LRRGPTNPGAENLGIFSLQEVVRDEEERPTASQGKLSALKRGELGHILGRWGKGGPKVTTTERRGPCG